MNFNQHTGLRMIQIIHRVVFEPLSLAHANLRLVSQIKFKLAVQQIVLILLDANLAINLPAIDPVELQ